MLFSWKNAFETWVICATKKYYMISYKVCQYHYTQRFLSNSFQVPQLFSSSLYSPIFSGHKKAPVLWNPISKILQVMYLTFSSYFINNLPIYLIFFNLGYFPISRNFFMIWHPDSQTTEYLVLLDFIAKSSFFQYLK